MRTSALFVLLSLMLPLPLAAQNTGSVTLTDSLYVATGKAYSPAVSRIFAEVVDPYRDVDSGLPSCGRCKAMVESRTSDAEAPDVLA